MSLKITGGKSSYGHIVGILMSDSTSPRIPGDPGHAETFPFPVMHEVLKGFPFEDLVSIKKDNIDKLMAPALSLQAKGVSLVVADCGLFGPFHEDFRRHLEVPFIGTALDLIPLLQHIFPADKRIAVITGDTRILTPRHLAASGVEAGSVDIVGMENSSEFNKVVIKGSSELDVDQMRQGVHEAASGLLAKTIGAVVLECTNLISYRADIQKLLNVPVFDLVSMIEFYVSGLKLGDFRSRYLSSSSRWR